MPPKRGKRQKAGEAKDDAAKEEPKTDEPVKEEEAKKEEATTEAKEGDNGDKKAEAKEETKDDKDVKAEEPKESDDKAKVKDEKEDAKDKEEPKKAKGKKPAAKKVKEEESKEEEKKKGKKKAAPKKEEKENGSKDEDKDDKKRSRDDEEDKDGEPSGKRARKSVSSSAFTPDDFTEKKSVVKTIAGRGTKLKDIPSVKASIESTNANSAPFQSAVKFLFQQRPKIHPKLAKSLLLDYNGYLPVQDKDMDEAKKEKEDEDIETKFSKKAYKLTVPEIKQLVDFFDVDKTPDEGEKVDKDMLIEHLLDFLSNPSADQVNGDTKKATAKAPAKKKKKAAGKPKADDDEEMEDASDDDDKDDGGKGKEGKMPSDKELRKWVKAYVACHNMNTATTKHALEVATSKFGIDMKPKKKTIKLFLTEEC